MIGQTLETILLRYREESELSTNPRMNLQVRDSQVALLRRTQEWVYDDARWPHLRKTVIIPVEAGLDVYDLPATINPARIINAVRVFSDGKRYNLTATIGASELNSRVVEAGVEGRSDRTVAYEVGPSGKIRIWPTPRTTEGHLVVDGYKPLSRFIQDNDRADIDDQLIYLYAAAETLAGTPKSKAKLDAANARMSQLLRQSSQIGLFTMGRGIPQRQSGNSRVFGLTGWGRTR